MYTTDDFLAFDKVFDTDYEDKAVSSRGYFLEKFPINSVDSLELDDYVIGKGTPSFCACVEAKSRTWANIQGSTAFKFGIYYGKTNSDPQKKYRFTEKFGDNEEQAFSSVKKSLLELLNAGEEKDFRRIDKNKLSQMLKAKILSLYFPETYLNVCSKEHLELFSHKLSMPPGLYTSEIQNKLIQEKNLNPTTKHWSNPKFMSFLYTRYTKKGPHNTIKESFKKPKLKKSMEVDFDSIVCERNRIGELSEEFAIAWERNRLIGLGYESLIEKIEDRRKYPADGFDYLSYSSPGQIRYIEVKSVGKNYADGSYRFFLSANELKVSETVQKSQGYYFYLVFYNKAGDPERVVAKQAKDLYQCSSREPSAYTVSFESAD